MSKSYCIVLSVVGLLSILVLDVSLIAKASFALMVFANVWLFFSRDAKDVATVDFVAPVSANVLFKDFSEDDRRLYHRELTVIKDVTENPVRTAFSIGVSALLSIPVFFSPIARTPAAILLLSLLFVATAFIGRAGRMGVMSDNRFYFLVVFAAFLYTISFGVSNFIGNPVFVLAYYYLYFSMFLLCLFLSIAGLFYFMATRRNFYEVLVYRENKVLTDSVLFSISYPFVINSFSVFLLAYEIVRTVVY